MRNRHHLLLLLATVALAVPEAAHGACNLIPSASRTFRGALGDLNRPFAAPGDFVEIGASPLRCAGDSPGFGATSDEQIVTVVFEPPLGGPRRVSFITTLDCNGAEATAKRTACEKIVGAQRVSCVQAVSPSTNLAIVERNGERKLSFRFPDTDALFAGPDDDRGASGPATIAVTPVASALPCGLATTTCATQSGTLACIDDLFVADGSCNPEPAEVFSGFTALPQPNDFQAACFTDDPPCTGFASETRFAVDASGNLLLPIHWGGVLIRQDDVPVPRLIHATIKSPLPFPIPDAAFLASYTPEGAKLPPIFEPQSDPSVADPDVVTLFGSADASYTILRFARRAGICSGGPLAGNACNLDTDCRGGTCQTTCVGGSSADAACTTDAECPGGGRCGNLFADFRPLAASGGPLPLRRQAAGTCFLPPHASCAGPGDCPAPGDVCIGAGICQLAPHASCAGDGDCPSPGDACVSYAFEASTAIPLESLTSGSDDVFSFTVNESTRLSDENGDGDSIDSVVTLRDRLTGRVQAMGAPSGCGDVAGPAMGRAVVRISDPPYRFPAVQTEDDLVAFLESESAEGLCDQSADDDRSDAILRVFALGGGERTATLVPPRVADTALLVDDQALAISNGLVFYRRPERGPAPNVTTRVSVGPGGSETIQGIDAAGAGPFFGLSADGQVTLFASVSNDLVPGDGNGLTDGFVNDRTSGVTERVNLTESGAESCCSQVLGMAVSGDGRYVAFGSLDPTIVADDTNGNADVFIRDRVAGTTERVSIATDGSQGTGGSPGLGSADTVAITPDGRFVLFYSQYTNLVADDTNEGFDLFVRDRLLGTTERVSLRADGGQMSGGAYSGAISPDGRFVAFPSFDAQMVPDDNNFNNDVFVRDRVLQRTERVSVRSDGSEGFGNSGGFGSIDFSTDGRFVSFATRASLVTGDGNGTWDVYVRDRQRGITELVSVATGDVPLPTGAYESPFGVHASISGDGRLVAWTAADGAGAVPGDDNGFVDAFVYDRQSGTTERVSVTPSGGQASGGDSLMPVLSEDGTSVAFKSRATDIAPGDGNGSFDAFVRTLDFTAPGLDIFADGAIDDTVLEVFDAATATATTICPAGQTAVAAGRAAFLRPESALGTAACPGGSLNATADSDTDDQVVQLWESGSSVTNLDLAASEVALSATHVAALADEAAQGGTALNGDGDTVDQVVHVRAIGAGAWTNVGEAADTLAVCGGVVPFITPESAQNADRSGDGDQDDRVLQVWDTAGAGVLHDTMLGAEEFVCGDGLIAFRSPESTSGAHRNGDADDADRILSVYDAATGLVHESGQAITPCALPECDPRVPYRISGRSVKFLTLEPEQGPTDLNGDGDAVDLVIQVFDLDTGRTKTIGTVREGTNPLAGGDSGDADGATVFVSTGRCLEAIGGSCSSNADCPALASCWNSGCVRETGVCATQDQCAPGSTCEASVIVPASPDGDADGIPDHLDSCPDTASADQTDSDGDGIGDPCDVSTCGNSRLDGAEICDGADDDACPLACSDRCDCCAPVGDPKAAVVVRSKRDAGVLTIRMKIPLGDYVGDEPVRVRFSDDDSVAIATADLGVLAPVGKQRTQWNFKSKSPGVQLVSLRRGPKKNPGLYTLVVKTSKWFTAARANQPAAASSVSVTIGPRCFSHVVTKKSS